MSASEPEINHDDLEDTAKRRRIARACEQCRKKKIRCDGEKTCNNCIAYRTECIFSEVTTKKRASPRGAKYIASLENRLEKMERLLQSRLQDNSSVEGQDNSEPTESRFMQAVHDNSMSDPRSIAQRNDSDLEQADQEAVALAEKMGYLFRQNNGEPEYVGASNSATVIVASQRQIREILGDASFAEFCVSTQRKVEAYQLRDYAANMSSVAHLRDAAVPKPVLPDKATSHKYIRLYFDHIYPLYPFLDKRDFLSRHEQMYDSTIEFHPSFHAIYLMVLSFGCHLSEGIMPGQDECEGGRLYAQAHSIIHHIVEKNSLQVVHALMLVAQYLETSGRMQILWTLLGTVVRMAQSLGLHRRLHVLPNSGSPKPINANTNLHLEIRRRTFWVIYIMENNLVVATGKPASIQDFDCDQELPVATAEELDHFGCLSFVDGTPFSYFHAQIQLARISQRAQRELYSVAAFSLEPNALFTRTQSLDSRLLAWSKNLPESFRPENTELLYSCDTVQSPLSVSSHAFDAKLLIAFLHICYFSLMTTVHRRTTLIGPANTHPTSRHSTPQSPPLSSRIDASQSIAVHATRSSLGTISRTLPRMQSAGIRLRTNYPTSAVLNIFNCILRSPTSPTVLGDIQRVKAVATAVGLCDLEHDYELSVLRDFLLELIRVSERAMAQAGTQGLKREWNGQDDLPAQANESYVPMAYEMPLGNPASSDVQFGDVFNMFTTPWTGTSGFYVPELYNSSGYLLGSYPVLQDNVLGVDPYHVSDRSVGLTAPSDECYPQSSTLPYSYNQEYEQTAWQPRPQDGTY